MTSICRDLTIVVGWTLVAVFASPSLAASKDQLVQWSNVNGEAGTVDALTGYKIVEQQLVRPPFLPDWPQVGPAKPRLIKVTMTVEEKVMEVEPGAKVWAFTFNGSVPGPMIVAHVGDVIELTLRNPATSL